MVYSFELIKHAKIDIYISGNFDELQMQSVLKQNLCLQWLV